MTDNLQFDRAEQTGAIACKVCGNSLPDQYYVVNGNVVCERCRRAVEEDWNRGGVAGRLSKAVTFGVAAAVVCAAVWYGVIKLTNMEFGILAIVVGFVVGGAVRKGSNGRGGWRYQALAVFLTYTAIVSSYVPLVIEAARERSAQLTKIAPGTDSAAVIPATTVTDSATSTDSTVAATEGSQPTVVGLAIGLVIMVGLVYALPFLAGFENIIGILIIGFALFEAWKLNQRAELIVSGPHQVSASSAPA